MTPADRQRLKFHRQRALQLAHAFLIEMRAWAAIDQASALHFVTTVATDTRKALRRKPPKDAPL